MISRVCHIAVTQIRLVFSALPCLGLAVSLPVFAQQATDLPLTTVRSWTLPFDAEAIGRANAKNCPEMADTVWITATTRDLPVALAHELVHVLTDSGDHSNALDNLMRDDTAPGNRHQPA